MKRIRNNRWLMVIVVLTLHCSLLTNHAAAQQCGIENTAFSSGERLVYDLHFNWKFVWFKVGQATMNTDLTTFEGKKAWRSSLVTGGNKKLDKFFTMRDTLLSYCSTDLSPLYFRKGAREGKRYYVDELWYTYPNNTCKLRMHRIDADGEEHWKDAQYKDCIYDMMSIFLRARNFSSEGMKEGDKIPMPISDAKHLTTRGCSSAAARRSRSTIPRRSSAVSSSRSSSARTARTANSYASSSQTTRTTSPYAST